MAKTYLLCLLSLNSYGEVTERLKVHAWNACVGKLTEGSNPSLTATVTQKPSDLYKKNRLPKEHLKYIRLNHQ